MTSREMPVELFTEFLDLYKRSPCLWKKNSPAYYNRNSKNAAYQKLIDLIKRPGGFPFADKAFVKAKIQSIRGSYRKASSKMKESKSAGKDYKPSLWYFDKLQFLRDEEEVYLTSSKTEEDYSIETEELLEMEDMSVYPGSEVVISLIQNKIENATKMLNAFANKPKKRKFFEENEIIEAKLQDEFDALGNAYATYLRTINDENQRCFCISLLNQVVLLASMGKLTESSHVSTKSINNEASDTSTLANSIHSGNENTESDLPPDESHDNLNWMNSVSDFANIDQNFCETCDDLNLINSVSDSANIDQKFCETRDDLNLINSVSDAANIDQNFCETRDNLNLINSVSDAANIDQKFCETHAADNNSSSALSFSPYFSPSKSHVNFGQLSAENVSMDFPIDNSKVDVSADLSLDSGISSSELLFSEIYGKIDDNYPPDQKTMG